MSGFLFMSKWSDAGLYTGQVLTTNLMFAAGSTTKEGMHLLYNHHRACSSSDSGWMHSVGVIKTLLITVGLGGGAGRKTSVRPAPLDPRDAPEDYRGQLAWTSHCSPHRSLDPPTTVSTRHLCPALV